MEVAKNGTPLPQRQKNQPGGPLNKNKIQNQANQKHDDGPAEKKPRFNQGPGGGNPVAGAAVISGPGGPNKGPQNQGFGGNKGGFGGNRNRGGRGNQNRPNFSAQDQKQQNDVNKQNVDIDKNKNDGGQQQQQQQQQPPQQNAQQQINNQSQIQNQHPNANPQHQQNRNRGGGGGGGDNRNRENNRDRERDRDGGHRDRSRGGRGGGGGGNQGARGGDDFFIMQRLRVISGPTHELAAVESVEETKFSGRNRLYVGNLTSDVSETDLHEMFKPYGEIGEVFHNPEKNFTFLKLDYHANAEKAKRELDGSIRKGRALRVRFAPNATILRVKNLNQFVTNELLYKSFEIFGPVERATIVVDDRGKHTGEGIIEYSKKSSANACLRYCSEKCFFLTASLRPCVVEPFEVNDDTDGLPEKFMNKKTPEFHHERNVGPRFADPGSFEHEYGTRWKQLHELYKSKQEALKRELKMEEDKLEAQMEYARYEHETELLRQELRKRESDNERKKMEWEMREKRVEEMRKMEEDSMRRQQSEMQSRILRQEEEMRRRQQENTLFMQAQQLNSLLDQQEGGFNGGNNTFDNFGGGGNNSPFDFRGGNNNNGNNGSSNQQEFGAFEFGGPNNQNQGGGGPNNQRGGGGNNGGNIVNNNNPWERRRRF